MPDNVNIKKGLENFFKNNPKSELSEYIDEADNKIIAIDKPWNDKSLAIEVNNENFGILKELCRYLVTRRTFPLNSQVWEKGDVYEQGSTRNST